MSGGCLGFLPSTVVPSKTTIVFSRQRIHLHMRDGKAIYASLPQQKCSWVLLISLASIIGVVEVVM